MEDFKYSTVKVENPYSKDWARGLNKVNTPGANKVNELIEKLNQCFLAEQKNFVLICYYLNCLKVSFDSYDNSYYKRYFDNKLNFVFYETVLNSFGLPEKEVNRYLNIYSRFVELETLETDVVPKLKSAFFGYSKSKLLELLPLSDSQIEKAFNDQRITVDSTCKDIRNYVKSLKASNSKADKVLEEPEEKPTELPDLDKPCNVSLNIKRENLEYIKGLGVEIDSYINKLIEDDKSNRCTD